jgi:hypothetical protein
MASKAIVPSRTCGFESHPGYSSGATGRMRTFVPTRSGWMRSSGSPAGWRLPGRCVSCTCAAGLENALASLEGQPDHPVRRAFRHALFDHPNLVALRERGRTQPPAARPPLAALMRWLDYYGEPVAAQLKTRSSLGPHSIGAVEAALCHVERAFHGRSQSFGNRDRLNLLRPDDAAPERRCRPTPLGRSVAQAALLPRRDGAARTAHDDPRGRPSLLA